ncbi:hypothetical protein PR048_010452 [Dryococelus australis]|uniref:Uncharacterized protein n=1 Tax=Dryococelus australis TaxID=614101 RepID=A0ABQ9I2T0_9NEOP|nr:hypothetical protein PR048_010452 [Dryococelus australis]
MKGRGKRKIPEKTRRPTASSEHDSRMRKSGVIRNVERYATRGLKADSITNDLQYQAKAAGSAAAGEFHGVIAKHKRKRKPNDSDWLPHASGTGLEFRRVGVVVSGSSGRCGSGFTRSRETGRLGGVNRLLTRAAAEATLSHIHGPDGVSPRIPATRHPTRTGWPRPTSHREFRNKAAALNNEALRVDEGEIGENGAAPQRNGWVNGRSPRKPAEQRHRNPGKGVAGALSDVDGVVSWRQITRVVRFDTSNYALDNLQRFPQRNKGHTGVMKDECARRIITYFVGLRPKLYAYTVANKQCIRKAKGVQTNMLQSLRYEDYRDCLANCTRYPERTLLHSSWRKHHGLLAKFVTSQGESIESEPPAYLHRGSSAEERLVISYISNCLFSLRPTSGMVYGPIASVKLSHSPLSGRRVLVCGRSSQQVMVSGIKIKETSVVGPAEAPSSTSGRTHAAAPPPSAASGMTSTALSTSLVETSSLGSTATSDELTSTSDDAVDWCATDVWCGRLWFRIPASLLTVTTVSSAGLWQSSGRHLYHHHQRKLISAATATRAHGCLCAGSATESSCGLRRRGDERRFQSYSSTNKVCCYQDEMSTSSPGATSLSPKTSSSVVPAPSDVTTVEPSGTSSVSSKELSLAIGVASAARTLPSSLLHSGTKFIRARIVGLVFNKLELKSMLTSRLCERFPPISVESVVYGLHPSGEKPFHADTESLPSFGTATRRQNDCESLCATPSRGFPSSLSLRPLTRLGKRRRGGGRVWNPGLPLLRNGLREVPERLACSPPAKANPVQNPGRFTPGFSHVGIVPDYDAGRRVFSGIPRFPAPSHSCVAPYSPRSPSSVLKTSLLSAA